MYVYLKQQYLCKQFTKMVEPLTTRVFITGVADLSRTLMFTRTLKINLILEKNGTVLVIFYIYSALLCT